MTDHRSAERCVDCWCKPLLGCRRCRVCTKQQKIKAEKRRQLARHGKRLVVCISCGDPREPDSPWRDRCKVCVTAKLQVQRLHRHERKQRCFAAYGNQCVCCGEAEETFLSIDHIFNDGAAHRRQVFGKNAGVSSFYAWLERNDFPKDRFQLLCHNCNTGKRLNGGVCPHKQVIHG